MSEIKISNLSVGDWVKIKGTDKIVKIAQINGDLDEIRVFGYKYFYWFYDLSFIEPIPLTPEILEKNGFEESSKYRWSNPNIGCACLRFGTKYWDIRINGRNRAYRPTRISIDNILHTHELQHALRLAGVKKEIEL